MSGLTTALVIFAALGTALVGGIFFAFSNFVMQALARAPGIEGMRVMQGINVTVLNGGFLGLFMGTALICLCLIVVAVMDRSLVHSVYLVVGALSYLGGTWALTAFGNVPLNNTLAQVSPDDPHANDVWANYLHRWTRLNSQRTICALLSALVFCAALVRS
ncbi:MAG: anthrone oxygenase family protein [Pseudomonadota bacterium]